MIVTGNLDSLFEQELGDNYVGAVRLCFGAGVGFNAGVLLINNRLWKEEHIRQKIWIKSLRSAERRTFGKYFEYFCMDDGSKFYIHVYMVPVF